MKIALLLPFVKRKESKTEQNIKKLRETEQNK
jgi:hypothetical protein